MNSKILASVPLVALLLLLPSVVSADFGACLLDYSEAPYKEFDPACGVRPFTDIFKLYVTPSLADSWTKQDVIDFMNAVIDSNTATYEDAFPRIWEYLCFADQDAAWDRILYYNGGLRGAINIFLNPDSSMVWSTGGTGEVRFKLLDTNAEPDSVLGPRTLALSRVFVHEFGHCIEGINRGTWIGESWQTEMLACGGEFLAHESQKKSGSAPYFDPSFESMYNNAEAEFSQYAAYPNFRIFFSYLIANHSGDPLIDTDDFVYRWIRSKGTTPPIAEYSRFDGLRDFLETDSTVVGATGSEKAGTLFHRAAMAAYIDRPDTLDGRFGFGEQFSPRLARLFEWLTPGGLRSRSIPPVFQVGGSQVSGVTQYTDSLDTQKLDVCRTRQLGIRKWGTDYMVFTADPAYFAGHPDTTLIVKLKGAAKFPDGVKLRAGYITYGSSFEPMYANPIREIVEVAPVGDRDDTVRVEFAVKDFGSAVKGVVLVLSLVTDPILEGESRLDDWAVTCQDPPDDPIPSGTFPDVPYTLSYGIGPEFLRVPQDHQLIQEAINIAVANQVVSVSLRPGNYEESVVLKDGVRVEQALDSEPPIIEAPDSLRVVEFPLGCSNRTVLSGFILRGGTQEVVRLRGDGQLEDCTLVADQATCTSALLASTLPGAGARGIAISLDSQAEGSAAVRLDGELLLDDFSIRVVNGTYGIFSTTPYSGAIQNGLLIGGKVGLQVDGDLLVQSCTVDSASMAGMVLSNDNALVQNCVVTNAFLGAHAIVGFGVGRVLCSITYPGDIIGVRVVYGNSQSDPLYRDPPAGDYSLRADSYGSPECNPSGALIGNYPVSYFGGTLARDTIVRRQDLDVVSDVAIPSGMTLTILPGGGLTFPEGTKLEVNGCLAVTGQEGSPVTLRGAVESPGSWTGIVLGNDGAARVEMRNATVLHAVCAIQHVDGPTADLVSLHGVTLTNFSVAGVWLCPFWADSVGVAEFDSVTIGMRSAPYGLWVDRVGTDESYNVMLRNVFVSGRNFDSPNVYGIVVNTTGTDGDHSPELHDVWVQDIPAGVGLVLFDTSPRIDSLYVVNCKTGIEMWEGGAPTITMDRAGGYGIFNATTGIYITDDVQASISDFEISSATTGVFTEGALGSSFSDGEILGGTTGYKTRTVTGPSSQDRLRGVRVKDFTTYGVWSRDRTCIDLGTVSEPGNNEIYATAPLNPARYVAVKFCLDGDMLKAESNWWGSGTPDPTKFATCVDWDPYLTTPPLGMNAASHIPIGIVDGPGVRLLRSPAVGVVDLDVTTWAGRSDEARIDVYDVTGRLVRHLVEGGLSPGSTRIRWDGVDDRGRVVPSGIYFLRVELPDYRAARRVVLVH